ncbi:MAG: TldD/PmbA family protein [Deltaproteobacteria bacterium]|nr:TldD/PmbA family protein [Deltaproteobacteria bacterium]
MGKTINQNELDRALAIARGVVQEAIKRGAEIAEVEANLSANLSSRVRLGEVELIEEAHAFGLGVRIIKDKRTSTAFTNDTTTKGLRAIVDDVVAMASQTEPDPLLTVVDRESLVRSWPDLSLFDPSLGTIDADAATQLAKDAERAALDVDARITNSEGASLDRMESAKALVTSGGFEGGFLRSQISLSVSPVADDAANKKRTASFFDARRRLSALMTAAEIGREAGRRTVAKLGAEKIETTELPVIFHPDAGRSLLALLYSCITGEAIYRRQSYLADREGTRVASEVVTIVDDPLIAEGPGSRPFDGEGLPSQKNVVVDRGSLATFLLDTYSAHRLGKKSTASAARNASALPSVAPTNFFMSKGSSAPSSIVEETKRGLYVTSMMGFGFNAATGDFSRGAEGFLIEDGRLGHAVSEVTIGLNFDELWGRVDRVGTDLDLRTRFATPTFRVARMTIAGR